MKNAKKAYYLILLLKLLGRYICVFWKTQTHQEIKSVFLRFLPFFLRYLSGAPAAICVFLCGQKKHFKKRKKKQKNVKKTRKKNTSETEFRFNWNKYKTNAILVKKKFVRISMKVNKNEQHTTLIRIAKLFLCQYAKTQPKFSSFKQHNLYRSKWKGKRNIQQSDGTQRPTF